MTVMEHTTAPVLRRDWARKALDLLSGATARRSFIGIAGQASVSGANFLTGVIIGRTCAKEQLGLYSLGFTLIVFVIELQMALISTPYMVYSPRLEGAQAAQYAGSALLHQFVMTLLVMIAFAAAATVFSFGVGPEGLAPVMWTLVVVVGFILMREFVRRICFAHLQMRMAFVFDCGVSVVQVGGLFLVARLGLLSASRAYMVLGAACGIAAVAWLVANRRVFILRLDRARAHFRLNWAFGKWVVASGVLWSVSMNFYPWILAGFRGAAAAGVFAACLGIAALANILLMGAQNFLGPKIAKVYADAGAAAMRRFAVKASVAFLIPMAAFCAALWLVGDPLVALLYGDKYAGNGTVVFILGLNLLAMALSFSFSRGLFALERADVDFAVNFAALLVLITFGIWMVKAYGAVGAALGLCVANTVASATRCGAFLWCLRRTEGRPA